MTKNKLERLNEVLDMRKKIKLLDLSETMPGIQKFKKILSEFVSEGESVTDRIKLPEINAELKFILTTKKGVESTLMLRHLN